MQIVTEDQEILLKVYTINVVPEQNQGKMNFTSASWIEIRKRIKEIDPYFQMHFN